MERGTLMKTKDSHKQLFLRIFRVTGLIAVILGSSIFLQAIPQDKPRLDVQNLFYPTGWMGDGEYGRKYIDFEGAYKTDSPSLPSCIRIKYTFGPKRWAGIYWQNKPDNWGDKQGNDYSKNGYNRITFWAKGETGMEVVEFKAGDINNPAKKYRDTFAETLGRISLSKDWRQYTIDLGQADLSSVIGGFCWVASADYNDQSIIAFYLGGIYFE